MSATNPHEVILNVAGTRIPGGLSDDEFLSWEKVSEAINHVGTPAGEVATSINLDERYLVTITLLETSQYHTVLAALYKAQKQQGGDASFTFFYRDPNTGEQLTEGAAKIVDPPDGSKGAEPGTRAWVLLLPDASYDVISTAG